MSKYFDIIIVGAGCVGASLSRLLSNMPIKVALIDKMPFHQANLSADQRPISLNYASKSILSQCGIWRALSPHLTDIQHVHISDQQHFGISRFSAKELNVPSLGYTIEMRHLQQQLYQQLQTQTNLTKLAETTVQSVAKNEHDTTLTLANKNTTHKISSSVIIAADGNHSFLRKALAIPVEVRNTGQWAISDLIDITQVHHSTAYERFTRLGPLALLPRPKQQVALIWCMDKKHKDDIEAMDDEQWQRTLQQYFGYRLGRLQPCSTRRYYPIEQTHVNQTFRHHTLFVGNAAQSLHPNAGQGLNLGLRDVSCLTQLIKQSLQQQLPIDHPDLFSQFAQQRKKDRESVQTFTDSLTKWFNPRHQQLSLLRNSGLLLTNIIPAAKNRIANHTLGLVGMRH